MSDKTTTVAQLKELVASFRDARDWAQFHSPKNLSMSIAIEAAELMAEFQWLTAEESTRVADEPERLRQAEEELADVVIFSLNLAEALRIDVADAVRRKVGKNAEKYPEDEYKGRF